MCGITYIEYLNRFNRWTENNDLPLSSVVLYYRLLDRFNRKLWPENVPVDTLRLMVMSGCQSKGAAYRARDALVQAGFIRYEKGKKGKSTTYFLCDILSIKRTESRTTNGTESETESGTTNGTHKERYKTKTKDKISLPSISPQGDNESFRAFWEAYPRKINFGKAQKAWEKLEPNTELTDIILSAVQEQSSSAQWQQEEGRFIPSPDNWLTNHCWEDKPLPAEPKRTRSYDLEEIERLSVFNLPDNL